MSSPNVTALRRRSHATMIDAEQYPYLAKFANPIKRPVRPILGRDRERADILSSLARPELSNVLLLAPAGSGKTALVQSTMMEDTDRTYLEVDPSALAAGLKTPDEMAHRLKQLFSEAQLFHEDCGQTLVLFIDEFHQIVQLSAAAVEALKPLLADSGTRGILVIAATTFEEYHQYIDPNQPLKERLQRINLTPTDEETTVGILSNMTRTYGVEQYFPDDNLLRMIYELTERYVPASVQPRKSILVLDSMIGRHRYTHEPINMAMLAQTLRNSNGIDVAFRVDGTKIKSELDKRVFSQDMATSVVARRLQLVVADLHDKSRPNSSFLFAGSTGVGKTELTKQLARLMFGDDTRRLVRFDMSEFALESSLNTLRSELTQEISNQGHAVLLFDEIEKAHRVNVRLLLQILDDGRLTDDNGRQVSFLNTYIVMTTNAGSEVFDDINNYAVDDEGSGRELEDFLKIIETSIRDTKGFPPELLGRIDEIVPFQPLSLKTKAKIAKKELLRLRNDVMRKHGVHLRVDDRVLTYLSVDMSENEAKAGGARETVRAVNKGVKTDVAQFINEHPDIKHVQVAIVGQMRAENKRLRKSRAKVVVSSAG